MLKIRQQLYPLALYLAHLGMRLGGKNWTFSKLILKGAKAMGEEVIQHSPVFVQWSGWFVITAK